jgi:glycosyltransferase involved in cell wall biosynthesis
MLKPKITIILPVYNGGNYLIASVNSVLEQSLTNFELLIIDDCSTDGSWEYLNNIIDPRIKLFKNETNKGLFYNLNYLITQSNTELIKLWAQDDIMLSDCLQTFFAFFEIHPEVGFAYSQRIMIDENGFDKENNKVDNTPEIISKELHSTIAYYTGSIAGNIANVCIHKKSLEKVGLFNESMKISADFDMWVRIAEFFPVGHINQKLIKLRDHSGQLSRNEKYYLNHVKEDLIVYRKLNFYSDSKTKKYGKVMMRNHKLLFYFTLMIKAFLKCQFLLSIKYFKSLFRFDNVFILFINFLKIKLFKIKPISFTINSNHEK